uniref:Cleavage and polyadenylation specificity factor subunit 4-like protein isoform X4 n=1 Tax=Camelus bactrianus TaxID=9837 RepID=A0A9W3FZI2_CAMBA|nr:putative cleavage and polyadenylation specificity factor subunit 4-like protein isoform X4 [Camelus bactrianus]
MSSGGKSERRFGNVCVCGMRVWEHTDKQRGGAVLVPPPPRGLQVGVPYTEWGGGPRGRLHLRGGRGRQLGAALAWLCLGSQAWESSQSWESASEPGPLRVLMYIHIVSTCSVGAASSSPSARERMQEVIAGLERFPFTFEKDVEMQKGTGLLPFQGMDKSGSAVCNFFAKGLCEKAGRVASFPHSCPLNLYKTCSAIQDHFLCLKRGLATAREMLQQAPRFLAHPNGGCARSGTTEGRRWWCASTGFVASARRATSASSCTSMTSPGCPSATSTPSSKKMLHCFRQWKTSIAYWQ